MRYQIRTRVLDGLYDVVDVKTGQVLSSAVSAATAQQVQAAWLQNEVNREVALALARRFPR